ncbi:MAG TPA: hypothetical protein VLQ93_14750, partial [Myxococcaceae bacterium]|nr:hypothetical protein [Myxococcaceae bacterium]
EDLTPLAGLASLQFISLMATRVEDLTPLAGLASLRLLRLSETQAKTELLKEFQKRGVEIKIFR